MSRIKVDSDLKDIMPEFLGLLEKELLMIDDAFQRQDLPFIMSFAHKLKGDAPGYGLRDLGDLGALLEVECRNGSLPASFPIFEKIKAFLKHIEIEYI